MKNFGEGGEIVEIRDEREPIAEVALAIIGRVFPPHERHTISALRAEVEEKRLGLLEPYDYHLLAMRGEDGEVIATVAGVYLAGLNSGFISYLATLPELRGRGVGRLIREALVECFREDAERAGRGLAGVLGEVRVESPWLRSLVQRGRAIPFDLTYYHPGMEPGITEERYVLYREAISDTRRSLPAAEVRQILYAIWRRGYRVAYPLQRPAFRTMLHELEGRSVIEIHPAFAEAVDSSTRLA